MKANRYLLTVIAIASVINLQAEKTLFGASGSASSMQTPVANMRSTSAMMYQNTAPRAVYVNPSQSVTFHVPNIINTSRRGRTSGNRYSLKSYGGGGIGSVNSGIVRQRASGNGNSQAVNFNIQNIPQLKKAVKSSREVVVSQGGGGDKMVASTVSEFIQSGSNLSEAAAESYYTLYDAQMQEEAEMSARRGRPGDLPDPYDEPVGDIPAVLMALLVAGYCVCKRKNTVIRQIIANKFAFVKKKL